MSEDVIEQIRATRKKRQEKLKQTIEANNPQAVFAEGFDNAIDGYSTDGRVIYSVYEIIGTLMNRDGMTEEEATAFFDFNIASRLSRSLSSCTPIFMYEE